jgi:Sugar (and other) transporter
MRVLLISFIPLLFSPPIPILLTLSLSHSISYHTIIQDMRVLVISSITLQAGQQFCGINAVFYYSTMIFKGAITGTYDAYARVFTLCFISFLIAHSLCAFYNLIF